MTGRADVAVVGMAGRFPKAADVAQLWRNLRDGVDGTTRFGRAEMAADGVPAATLDDPAYVPVRGFLEDAELFDAAAFDIPPREAELLDPQQRLLLECASEALEEAALGGGRGERVGVFAGTTLSKYLLAMSRSPRLAGRIDPLTMVAAERDCAATRIAYKLNLTGPAFTVQSACSTSLVAVHLAAAALRRDECDAALAGGASLSVPRRMGYRHHDGGPFAADGVSRPFDHRASGTVPGDGAAFVLLRRLEDAVADGDRIFAVLAGSAVNNDGAAKVGFTAPGVDGQIAVIRAAHEAAGVCGPDIGYVEAHGTATPVGDPIEVAALTSAFGDGVAAGSCALGSVKSNLGHLDSAAGVTGLIKTVLQLHHRELVPSLHFEEPNPLLELERTPFRVNTELRDWTSDRPRRASVSSFGVGGTNAHLVLEEYRPPAPDERRAAPEREEIVVLSAASRAAASAARSRWAGAVRDGVPDGGTLADLAHCAATGRPQRRHRWFTVAGSAAELAGRFEAGDRDVVRSPAAAPRVVWVFPGTGGQYRGMAPGLAATEPVFAGALARCVTAARRHGVDLPALLAPDGPDGALDEPVAAVATVFAVEFALASLLSSWGVRPDALVGHSTGESVAGAVAGVFRPEDALGLLVLRAELAASVPVEGAMLQVDCSEADCAGLLTGSVSVGAVNAPGVCTLTGARPDVDRVAERLPEAGIGFRRIPVRGAGHSALLDPMLPRLRDALRETPLAAPRIPIVSTVTGHELDAAEATDPEYWVRQFRSTVRFADALGTVLDVPGTTWVLGPGRAYQGWARRVASGGDGHLLLSCLPERDRAGDDRAGTLTALGRHWCRGGTVDWAAVRPRPDGHRRVTLPPHPFQGERYWAPDEGWVPGAGEDPAQTAGTAPDPPAEHGRPDLDTVYRAPGTERERTVVAIWSDLLGIADVGVDDDFFELGGDSMLATRIAAALRTRTGTDVSPRTLLTGRTPAALAAALDDVPDTPAAEPDLPAAAERSRARVRALLACRNGSPGRSGGDRAVLVGGTGHLGPYLVRELLAQRDGPLTVLVRGTDDADASARLRALLTERQLWSPFDADRVEVLAADLRRPGFGLSGADRDRLARETAEVHHCAAEVNFVRPYDRMEPANVHAAETALELARDAGAHLHFLSTLGVLRRDRPGAAPYPEQPLPTDPGSLPNGYLQTKWVAEQGLDVAVLAGEPVSIYRICAVAGDSVTGYCNADDLFWRIVATVRAIGTAPRRDVDIVSVPVDAAARALVTMTARSDGGVAHLAPDPVTWSEVWEWLRSTGAAVEETDPDRWRAEVACRVRAGADLPLGPVVDDLAELMPDEEPRRFATARAHALLDGTGVDVPALDRAAFVTALGHLDARPPDVSAGAGRPDRRTGT